MTPASQQKNSLSMKDISKLVAFFGLIAGGIAWVHAEVTIPQVLTKTSKQMQEAIDRHSGGTHRGALTEREFRLWAEMREKSSDQWAEQIIHRLDTIESELRKK